MTNRIQLLVRVKKVRQATHVDVIYETLEAMHLLNGAQPSVAVAAATWATP